MMPIKDITIEAFRNDYPGHPEKPSFIANVGGIDTYIRVGLKVEDGSIITYNSIRESKQPSLFRRSLQEQKRQT